ncbi:BRF1-domain-containing protein [Lentinus tigrinus ALCF2SS1-7]|uniref:B-related factor 1 n=1 Tax=Lentinus tigrinus ALCF2SS1-6 TaxID=1328759 RepID=A0A5C2RZU2_9APHY|nr:BRF1-domain-containing protein [Lentinus tigrinus ALCF2SS1-6]RPD71685.1 BRF1-domain-containing protein [Lentinus tigrinus ALCF2SS1-7]
MTVCTDCGGTVIEYDTAAGNGFCVQCGTVVEENTIVNEVTFGETSAGAAMVQGSFVAQGATRARMGGMFGNRGSAESREQTIANASRKIQQVASAMRLSETVSLAATRLYTLAVEHKFTKGRKSMNVVAVCLYVACRQKETRNYMLIDFSDLLQVNVFELGHTYLQLVQTLNLRLPLVDPSHYISRFAALLEFGEETHQVAMDAVRLVQRFDRDWMTKGRRPAGICGACLLLAARMNNFRRSVAEIVQVVKIADTTLKKRLEEFRKTPSGALTLADFRTVWLEDEMDPPAYTKGKEKEEKERLLLENGGVLPDEKGKKKGKGKKKKRKRGEESDEEEQEPPEEPQYYPPYTAVPGPSHPPSYPPVDPTLLNQGILAGTSHHLPLFLPEDGDEMQYGYPQHTGPIDPALFEPDRTLVNTAPSQHPPPSQGPIDPTLPPDKALSITLEPPSPVEETVDAAVTQEVSDFLTSAQSTLLNSALDEAEQRRREQFEGDDELLGLDDEELDRFLLTEEEVRIKERVWVEMNKDYLEAIAAKAELQADEEKQKKTRKRRKTNNKPRDASTPHGSTAAESVRNLIKKNPKYSKKINYNALKELFTNEGSSFQLPTGDDDKEDEGHLYTMDDKDDGEGMLIVEEEGGGGVGQTRPATKSRSASLVPGASVPAATAGRALEDIPEGDDEEDAEGEEDVEDDAEKDDAYGEWDVYEQEV